VRYRVSDADRNAYFDCLDVLRREIHECGVGELTLPDRDAFVGALRMGDGTHQMGLTRMSSNARDGVVDADCRLHGSRNVFIASTAVFPTSGAAPPTLTLAALALRLARRVEGEMASGE
jgi:choline dehydrogenase-like flavoprotein